MSQKDWDPQSYGRFARLRLQPALDLLSRIGPLPKGQIVDLGCGAGAVGPALRDRFGGHDLIGIDSSPAMLNKAKATGVYTAVIKADAGTWLASAPPALIFSNALCHWLPDHGKLFRNLTRQLTRGGTLAVQMPRQQLAPSYALIRQTAARIFPDRFDQAGWTPQVAEPAFYHEALSALGDLDLWETEYFQSLAPVSSGHPVRHFTQSTAMRPYLQDLDKRQADQLIRAYDAALAGAYPLRSDGSVLFPFRRLFFVLRVG